MPVMIIIIAILFALAIIFSVRTRDVVVNYLRYSRDRLILAWEMARDAWNADPNQRFLARIRGSLLTFFSALRRGIGGVPAAARRGWIALMKLWCGWCLILLAIGYLTNSYWSAFFLGILPPIWIILGLLFMVGRRTGFVGTTITFLPLAFVTAILGFSLAGFSVGLFSPYGKSSLDRYSGNRLLEFFYSYDKKSKQSEPESGVFAVVVEETQLLNEKLQPFGKITEKGTVVMVTNLGKKKVADEDSEGLTRVMIPDRFGNFIKGEVGYVPSRVLDWSWKEYPSPVKEAEYAPPAPNYYSAPATVQSQPVPAVYETPEKDYSGKYEICWERYGKQKCIRPCIKITGDSLTADYTNGAEHLEFDGRSKGDGRYSGDITFTRPGKVSTRNFSLDFKKMSGCMEIKARQPEEVIIKKLS